LRKRKVITLVILGILAAIAIVIFLALLERWRVEAATNQLVADLRLAHTSASNRLTDWRVVALFGREEDEEGPDYYLVQLAEPYDEGDPKPTVVERKKRFFPGNVQMMNVRNPSGTYIKDNQSAVYWVNPWDSLESSATYTRPLEFNSDGTMRYPVGPNGSVCVSVDTEPHNRVISLYLPPRGSGWNMTPIAYAANRPTSGTERGSA
jgi:type II secretory pathway pseudopilin PulG